MPLLAGRAAVNGDFLSLQTRLVELFKEQGQAVVRVKAAYRPAGDEEKPQVIIGSGFFTSRDGHVLTNASIAYKPDRVWVEYSQVDYAAEVIGADPATNLSLLRVLTPPEDFHFLHLDDSPELPPVGSLLVRISAPLEFSPSPCLGLVAGCETRVAQSYFPCAYLRTTIPAGPGDGGAAFLDLNGKLVGIQVYSIPDLQGTYLLPARAARRIRDDLHFSGHVTYGWIGFEIDEENSIRNGNQIVIRKILSGTPAEKAGLRPGDLLRKIGDYAIHSVSDLRNAMFYMRVGQYTRVEITRIDEEMIFNMKVAPRPEPEQETGPRPAMLAGPAITAGAKTAGTDFPRGEEEPKQTENKNPREPSEKDLSPTEKPPAPAEEEKSSAPAAEKASDRRTTGGAHPPEEPPPPNLPKLETLTRESE